MTAEAIEPGLWSAGEPEYASQFQAPEHEVLVGRKHDGDETGKTYYRTARVHQGDGVYLTTANVRRSAPVKESAGVRFVAPAGTVLVGRTHSGDENGSTTYYYADVIDQSGNKVDVVHGTWSSSVKEYNSSYEAPANQVLVGRWHDNDETGPTQYLTATLY
ncbi:hypothetical protein [Streptomyces sp. NPDC088785]|uniref:hypothetical protein n=1 Tax=Streptomyces sp. NPDC088785 TaxID=3365897 RepID=UPI0038266521